MNYEIQVVTLPVADVDRARAFYTDRAGFRLDVDYGPNAGYRVVQVSPPGSACAEPDGNTWMIQEIGHG